MRHLVRQARVNVIRKLVREAKTLRAKRGTEMQQNKYKRKADRLTEEVLAAKKLKDDDISKFVITNKKSLQDVLTDQTSDASTRIMVKLGNYKSLAERVATIKEKFPNYEEHLGPGRKKMVKLQRKAKKQGEKADQSNELQLGSNRETMIDSDTEDNNVEESEVFENPHIKSFDSVTEDSTIDEHVTRDKVKNDTDSDDDEVSLKCDSEPGSILRIQPTKKSVKQKNTIIKVDKNEKPTIKKKSDTKVDAPKIISKEATVKRFTELLKEEDSGKNSTEEISNELKEGKFKIEKEVDPFFMTDEGDTEYMSVVVPKITPLEENEEGGKYENSDNDMGKKFSKGTFFTNLDRSNGKREYSKNNGSGNWRHELPQKRPGRDFTLKTKPRNDLGSAKKVRTEFSDQSQNRSEKVANSDDRNLHPSWVAKKKQQELLKQGFQGQKIVFADD
ncbi:serum response factor-binding protein 1 isoform X2 [Cephus cinctus]|nr:serum response factor-binding protein 1 isoform X2 [Cephus cinctus]